MARQTNFLTTVASFLIGVLVAQNMDILRMPVGKEEPPIKDTSGRLSKIQSVTIDPMRYRTDLPMYLEKMKFKRGIELGVQAGDHAEHVLKNWPSCEQYILVDLWAHQKNYHDIANVDDGEQNKLLEKTRSRLAPYKHKTVFYRNYTSEAVKYIPDESLDFIYVDARHDYCGVKEDIELYWPKLRKGGLMAGHDYLEAGEVGGQDWSLCIDGTRNAGAVKGAVDEFTRIRGLQVVVSYREQWPNWMFRKPYN